MVEEQVAVVEEYGKVVVGSLMIVEALLVGMKVDLLVVVMTALIGGIVKVELALVVESVLIEVVLRDLL